MRISFTYAALDGLDVWAADVQNAFLQATCSKKYYAVCGPYFGSEFIGKLSIIVRVAYGRKSAGADFRNHLRDCMDIWDMNLVSQTRMCGCGQKLGHMVKIIMNISCCTLTIACVYLKIRSLRSFKLTNRCIKRVPTGSMFRKVLYSLRTRVW